MKILKNIGRKNRIIKGLKKRVSELTPSYKSMLPVGYMAHACTFSLEYLLRLELHFTQKEIESMEKEALEWKAKYYSLVKNL